MLNFIPEGFISLIDARKKLTSLLSNPATTDSEHLRNAFDMDELALYAVSDTGTAEKITHQLLDSAMSLDTGVLTFSHIGRGSNPPMGLNWKQIVQLARDPLVVGETEFQEWLKKWQDQPNKKVSEPRRKARATDHAADIDLERKINRILDHARNRYPPNKRPPMRQLAKEVAGIPESPYKASTIRHILEGTYPAMKRLKIRGLLTN